MERESRQHNIPKSIGKTIGMSKKSINKYIEMIPQKIHYDEDRYVPVVLREIKRAKGEGIKIVAEDVLKMRDSGWFRK
jgi:hypothetical protein